MTTITRFTKEQLLQRLEEQMSSARYAQGFVQDSEILRDIEMDLRLAEMAQALLNTPLPESACDVLKERHRQITVKGYSPEQDDTYIEGELAAAAISYIEPMEAENYWPADWLDDSFKPSDYRRNLVKACALLLAEIERYDRQEATGG